MHKIVFLVSVAQLVDNQPIPQCIIFHRMMTIPGFSTVYFDFVRWFSLFYVCVLALSLVHFVISYVSLYVQTKHRNSQYSIHMLDCYVPFRVV